MTVSLSPDLEALVHQKVQTGQYDTPDDVMRQAMQLSEQRDRLARIREAIAIADAQIDLGQGIALTQEVWDEIDRELDEAVMRGETPDTDVCP